MPDSSNLNRGYGRLGGSFKNWGGTGGRWRRRGSIRSRRPGEITGDIM